MIVWLLYSVVKSNIWTLWHFYGRSRRLLDSGNSVPTESLARWGDFFNCFTQFRNKNNNLCLITNWQNAVYLQAQ